MPARADFLIEHADLIATCAGPAPRRGAAQHEISTLRHGAIAACEGRIVYVGEAAALPGAVTMQKGATRIDARGCTVVPGFVDPRTHAAYARDVPIEALFAATIAGFATEMTLEESLIAATLNAAWSLNRAADAGSLEPGKLLDAVIIKGGLEELLRVGAPSIRMVIQRAKIVSWTQE